MITSMSDIVCVTARKLCSGDFLEQLGRVAEAEPRFIILREKDLSEEEYTALAQKAGEICKGRTKLMLHYFWRAALSLGADSIHLPLYVLREMELRDKERFRHIGVSCHSVADAVEAEKLGAGYITAGHIFATDCKKGLAPREIGFLRQVVASVGIPVYAIGGISPGNIGSVRECGAAGACVMSSFMKSSDPAALIEEFNRK